MNPVARTTIKKVLKRVTPPALRPPLRRLWRRRRLIGASAAGVLLATVGVAAAYRVANSLVATIVGVAAVVAALGLELRRARGAERILRRKVAALETSVGSLVLYQWTRQDVTQLPMPANLVRTAVQTLLERGDVLDAYALIAPRGLTTVDATTRRKL